MRATCLGGPSVVGDRWRWCPVALSGVGLPLGMRGLEGPDVVPAQGIPDSEGRTSVPSPVQPVQVIQGRGPYVCYKAPAT